MFILQLQYSKSLRLNLILEMGNFPPWRRPVYSSHTLFFSDLCCCHLVLMNFL